MEGERHAGPRCSPCACPLWSPRCGGVLGEALWGASQGCWIRAGKGVEVVLCSPRARPLPGCLCR
eukprot:3334117-Alexandrium_andersonii.AAC.1